MPGAWVVACVAVEDGAGVAVLASQDRWDRMEDICKFWLEQLNQGVMALDFKQLRSDRGFVVHACRHTPP